MRVFMCQFSIFLPLCFKKHGVRGQVSIRPAIASFACSSRPRPEHTWVCAQIRIGGSSLSCLRTEQLCKTTGVPYGCVAQSADE